MARQIVRTVYGGFVNDVLAWCMAAIVLIMSSVAIARARRLTGDLSGCASAGDLHDAED